jgi:hypothetical protein
MKHPFKHTKLAAAMAVTLGAAVVATPSQAVNLSDNGLGEVGLVSYYTALNNIDTQLSIVNTSDVYVVAVKLRFREADNTRDARDFNIFLSPNDVWTGVVTMGEDGETPVIRTFDNSCTAPALPASPTAPGGREIFFTNSDYITEPVDNNNGDDGGVTDISRTQDGHFEVLVMGVDRPAPGRLSAGAVHTPAGVPLDCSRILQDYAATNGAGLQNQFSEPLNVVKVSANLIRVDAGVAGGMPVDMLANFFNPGCPGVPEGQEDPNAPCPEDLMTQPATNLPNLSLATPPQSAQITELGPIEDNFADGADAVSSLFMAESVINEYAIGGASNAQTDWVITFPTKNFYVDQENIFTGQVAPAPFEEFFQPNGRSCVGVAFDYYDREERSEVVEDDIDFSPAPPGTPGSSICEETQILAFGDESVLNGNNLYGVPLVAGFDSGWMRLVFRSNTGGLVLEGENYLYSGLPVTGFGIKSLENGVSSTQGVLNYGIVQTHAFDRMIVPSP